MKKKLYSVLDTCACVFSEPFLSINDDTALRDFKQGAAKSNIRIDLALYCIGEFNDADGLVVPLPNPRRLLTGVEVEPADTSHIPFGQADEMLAHDTETPPTAIAS